MTAIEGITLQQGIDPARGGDDRRRRWRRPVLGRDRPPAGRLPRCRPRCRRRRCRRPARCCPISRFAATTAVDVDGEIRAATRGASMPRRAARALRRVRRPGGAAPRGSGSATRSRRAIRTRCGRSRCRCAGDPSPPPRTLERFRAGLPRRSRRAVRGARPARRRSSIVTWHAHVRCALREAPPSRARAGFGERPAAARGGPISRTRAWSRSPVVALDELVAGRAGADR